MFNRFTNQMTVGRLRLPWHSKVTCTHAYTRADKRANSLAPEAQGFDDASVALDVVVLYIVQKSATPADHHQKPSSGMMILFVDFQVFGQV